MSRLFSEFWSWRVERSPEFATLAGIQGHNHRLEEFTEERWGDHFHHHHHHHHYHHHHHHQPHHTRFLEDLATTKMFHARAADMLARVGKGSDEDNLQFFMAEVVVVHLT